MGRGGKGWGGEGWGGEGWGGEGEYVSASIAADPTFDEWL